MYIYIYIHTYIQVMYIVYTHMRAFLKRRAPCTANLRAKLPDFRGFDLSRILMLRGGILLFGHAHREFIEKFESSNLSRNNISREIWRARFAGELIVNVLSGWFECYV